jgi:cytochrome c biogenesis protein
MLPVRLGAQNVFLLGVRDTPAESFRYLRVPADDTQTLQGWLRLRQALADGAMREEAAKRFAQTAAPTDRADLRQQLASSAQKALEVFAGVVPVQGEPAGQPPGGLQALSLFIEQVVPADQRERTSGTLVRLLNGSLFELLQLSRERVGLPRQDVESDEVRAFMTQAVLSLSDAMFYPAPVILAMQSFEQRQASVLQVTRTPGRNVVYLGCVLLIVGVFAMLYIRERRLWVWLQDDGQGGTRVQMAMSSTRQTLDTDGEFDRLRTSVLGA